MRSVRTLLATAGAVALVSAGGCGAAANASGVWVEVAPGTISAGFGVSIRASCGDNANSATVSSRAFTAVTLAPQATLLIGDVTVPPQTRPGTYDVKLTCRTGSTATTTLTVIGGTATAMAPPAPTLGPHTGGGFLANGDSGRTVAASAWIGGGVALMVAAAVATRVSNRRRRRTAAPR